MPQIKFQEDLKTVLGEIQAVLIFKNAMYGDAVLNPNQIFSTCAPIELIRVRIDDKLSRIRNTKSDNEDAKLDLLGYLLLERIALMRTPTGIPAINAPKTFEQALHTETGEAERQALRKKVREQYVEG